LNIKIPVISNDPTNNYKEHHLNENVNSLVVVGINGSGKTRFGVWLEKNNDGIVHRISAQKSLNISANLTLENSQSALKKIINGTDNPIIDSSLIHKNVRNTYRWQNNPETLLLDDFSMLINYLIADDYEASYKFRENILEGNPDSNTSSKLKTIFQIIQNIIPNTKMTIKDAKIHAVKEFSESQVLVDLSQMSDGERSIFYFAGQILALPENTIFILDEPELHFHKSILINFWNEIERIRSDCFFIYITHDLDFALSRPNSQLIWMKEYLGENVWKYEILENDQIPERLKIELYGNREKILFTEGENYTDLDYKLYSSIFDGYKVIPVGSCENVLSKTKTFNEEQNKHHLEVFGIIDRDSRTQAEIEKCFKSYGL